MTKYALINRFLVWKKTPPFSPQQTFSARPTVLLRVIVPSSGFAITVRALLDTGAALSSIKKDLAKVLFESGGATCEYFWPRKVRSFTGGLIVRYRRINNLTLQSIGNESVKLAVSMTIDEFFPHFVENLPVDLVVEKMDTLGLSMVQSGNLERTMWSNDEPK